MQDLIERLEKATGPDREVDSLIADWQVGKQRISIGGDARYTGSYDAARLLIPAGLFWLVSEGKTRPDEPLGGAQIRDPKSLEIITEAEHQSAIIALCIAGLKARAFGYPDEATQS